MESVPPNTPVIAGVGFCQNHSEDPRDCPEPCQLMIDAIRDAAMDAGAPALVRSLESIAVQQGMWGYRNPGRLLAEALDCPGTKSVLSDLGVLQLTPLFDLCRAIAAGEQSIGVVTGGEAKFRELRSKITGIAVGDTEQPADTPAPDLHLTSPDPFATHAEGQAGLFLPVEYFAVIESALRHYKGWTIDEDRDRIAALYSEFSHIAASNPHAWSTEPMSAAAIRDPVGKNAMIAFPYTKRHNSQWNVNQAVAIIVCSAARANALGIDRSRWIYPISAARSRHVNCLAQQRTLYSHPGTVVAGERACALAGVEPRAIQAADLYSCFPSAVQSFALDLKLEGVCPWSVTGSMAFAGGPYNHAALDGVARMVEVLRDGEGMPLGERRIGLVSNLSGIFGKQGVVLFSNEPNARGYRFEDVTDIVAAQDPPVAVITGYAGPATIAGCTVSYKNNEISHGFAYCDTPAGQRTVVRIEEHALLEAMTREEFVGRAASIGEDGILAVGD